MIEALPAQPAPTPPQPPDGSRERPPVVMLTSSYPRYPGDGIGSFLEPIAHGVARRGRDVHVVAPWHPLLRRPPREQRVHFHFFRYAPSARLHLFGYASALNADVSLRPTAYAVMPMAVASGCWTLRRVVTRTRPQLVHAHWIVPSGVMATLTAGRIPLVISLHGSDVFLAESRAWVGRAARAAFRRASAVTACSDDLRRRAVALGARADTTMVIPYGVDTNRFRPNPEARARRRRSLALPEGAPLLVAAGRLVRKKGLEYLVDATPPLVRQWPSLTVVVVGDGDLRAGLERRAVERSVSDHIRFVGAGSQDDVGEWFAAAAVIVVPSVRDEAGNVDGLPNVVLEALASGTPVVTTPVGGIASVAIDGRTARVVPQKDGTAIAAAVGDVLHHPSLAAALGAAARDTMSRSHGWSAAARRLEEVYTLALAPAPRPSCTRS